MTDFYIRPLSSTDTNWVRSVLTTRWGAEIVVVHGEIFHPSDLPGFAAFIGKEPVGLLTYIINGNECEIITLDSWHEAQGIGTALIEATRVAASHSRCARLFLVTTNNNTHALHFYQKHGFVISDVRINEIEKSRKLKPQIPLQDGDGLPIRDEIELEYNL